MSLNAIFCNCTSRECLIIHLHNDILYLILHNKSSFFKLKKILFFRKVPLLVKRRNVGFLICRYCPYRSNSRQLLNLHEHFHSRDLSVKCSFCTFTTKSTDLILNHIQLEHPERKDKVFKVTYVNHKKKSPPKNAVSSEKV